MRITKRQLKRIIKEEKATLLEYGSLDAHGPDDYTTYVITPVRFVEAAEEYLTDEELASIGRDKIERIAIDRANELAWETAGSMEGFGSSDRAAYIKYFLDDLGRYAGFKTDWKGPRGSLQVVREGKAKIAMHQLRRIIKETVGQFAPTAAEEAVNVNSQVSGMALPTDQAHWEEYGISTGEELALSLLGSTYSDMYKSIHGIRPRWENFNTPAEAQAAIDSLNQEVEDMIAANELEAQQQAEYEKKEKEIQALMPGEFDFQHIPKRSGMGRRMENYIRITPNALKRLIKEVIAEDKEGKGACPKSGCITRSGDKWRIISNKTGKLWPQKYDTKEKAENALKAYHVHN